MISIEAARSSISLDFNFPSPFSFNTGSSKLSTTQAEFQACEAQLATEERESDKKRICGRLWWSMVRRCLDHILEMSTVCHSASSFRPANHFASMILIIQPTHCFPQIFLQHPPSPLRRSNRSHLPSSDTSSFNSRTSHLNSNGDGLYADPHMRTHTNGISKIGKAYHVSERERRAGE